MVKRNNLGDRGGEVIRNLGKINKNSAENISARPY